jgi:hypothetical protein
LEEFRLYIHSRLPTIKFTLKSSEETTDFRPLCSTRQTFQVPIRLLLDTVYLIAHRRMCNTDDTFEKQATTSCVITLSPRVMMTSCRISLFLECVMLYETPLLSPKPAAPNDQRAVFVSTYCPFSSSTFVKKALACSAYRPLCGPATSEYSSIRF